MGNLHAKITPSQAELIRESKVFFVASVDPDLGLGADGQGPVNLSPKGNVPLCIIDERRVAYLDYHGSGDETARHANAGGPITVMVMSMGGEEAAIVRLYGHATVAPVEDSPLAERLLRCCPDPKGLRQVVTVDVERTLTSCGYGVPVFEYVRDRRTADRGRRFR